MATRSNVSSRKRQPKGIPIGGEFAHNEHDEASSLLSTSSREDKKSLTSQQILEESRTATRVYGRRMKLSAEEREETTQVVIANSVEELSRKGWIDGGLVNVIAKRQVGMALGRRGIAAPSGANNMARPEFYARVREDEAVLDRALTQSERDAIADDILDNWYDQKHKPTRGFHIDKNDTSLGSMSHDLDVHPALIDPYSPEVAIMSARNERADAVLEQIEGTKDIRERNAIVREARAKAWNIVAEHHGVPTVRAKLSDASRKTILSHVKNSGGALAVAERYERGESDSATEALFMPFRERVKSGTRIGWRRLSDAQMDSISDMIRSNPRVADELWTSALAQAK